MFKITPVDKLSQKVSIWHYARVFIYKVSGMLEILAILALWLYIFSSKSILGGFTREEIITYIIVGNIISFFIGYVLHRVIRRDVIDDNSKLLLYKPFKYLFYVLLHGLGKIILPFILSVIFYLLLLYFFIDSLVVNLGIHYISIILAMVTLAFIIEFLISYLVNLHIFWVIESGHLYVITVRLKRFLAGQYFPLSLLPLVFVKASLFLPFAYSFFVPMQLYLKKIDLTTGVKGLGVQVVWIILLYMFIQKSWSSQLKKQAEK